jgi:hypothetical protein
MLPRPYAAPPPSASRSAVSARVGAFDSSTGFGAVVVRRLSLCARGRSVACPFRRDHMAAVGEHFGRADLDLPWEKTGKVGVPRSAAGLKGAVDRELAPLTT